MNTLSLSEYRLWFFLLFCFPFSLGKYQQKCRENSYLAVFLLEDNCITMFVSFCCIAIWIGHMYTYVPLCLALPPALSPHPPMTSPSTERSSLCCLAASHWLAIVQWWCVNVTASLLAHPTLSFPPSVHKPVLCGLQLYPYPRNRFITTIF